MQIRILVVDDDQDIVDLLRVTLSKEGYEVTTCTDPTQVVGQLKASDYHLVLLDFMMPQMDGTQVLEEIRKVDDDVAVIMLTAHPSVDNAVASLRLDASDFLKKPIETQALIATVSKVLAKKGLSSNPEADLHRSIGQVIRDKRTEQDLTLKQLARRTGLSVSLLSQIERAESSASISSLYKIASALRLKMATLFGEA